jgi:integrase
MSTKRTKRIPKLENCNGRGRVYLNGRYHYLGPIEAPKTVSAYARIISEWSANNGVLPVAKDEITVTELCRDYWLYCKDYYLHSDGTPTNTLQNVRDAVRPLNSLYGPTLANDFGPLALRALRDQWIERDLSRRTVTYYTSIVKRCFKWAAGREKIRIEVFQALTTVEPLKKNRSKVRETRPVLPVPQEHIEVVFPFLPPQLGALVRLQLLTGTRAGELLKLRSCELDVSKTVWTTSLSDHKTSYRDKVRTIYFGPKAQSIIKPFLQERGIHEFLFSPRDAEMTRHSNALTHRRDNQTSTLRKTKRTVGDHYSADSYRRAITRACDKAGVPRWTPHRLRHNAATYIRKEYGLEAAQIILGHSKADVTQLYAEVDEAKAIRVIKEIG